MYGTRPLLWAAVAFALAAHLAAQNATQNQQRQDDHFVIETGGRLYAGQCSACHGANGDHQVVLNNGRLECDCDGFAHRGEGICAHVLGVEHHFKEELPPNAVIWPFAAPAT